eukprot:1348508-Amorphochlora_amoeboformis.AAC.1
MFVPLHDRHEADTCLSFIFSGEITIIEPRFGWRFQEISSNLGFRVESRKHGAGPLGCGGHRNVDRLRLLLIFENPYFLQGFKYDHTRCLLKRIRGGADVKATLPIGKKNSTDWG